jgi:hypothetical protein
MTTMMPTTPTTLPIKEKKRLKHLAFFHGPLRHSSPAPAIPARFLHQVLLNRRVFIEAGSKIRRVIYINCNQRDAHFNHPWEDEEIAEKEEEEEEEEEEQAEEDEEEEEDEEKETKKKTTIKKRTTALREGRRRRTRRTTTKIVQLNLFRWDCTN